MGYKMDSIKTITNGNFIGRIYLDEDPESPREWNNQGVMICHHKRYNLGDAHHMDFSSCTSWDEEEAHIRKHYGKDCIMLPIHMYDHSGISLSTTPFNCRFDSGRLGTIVISRKFVRKEYGVQRITEKTKNQILMNLKNEVDVYNDYVSGNVYRYSISEVVNGEETLLDSCGSYYGYDNIEHSLKAELQFNADKQNNEQGIQQELELV